MKTKNPFVAGLLNVVFPGLGSLYVGNWKRTIFNFLLGLAFIVGGFLGLPIINNGLVELLHLPPFIVPGLYILIYVFAMFGEGRLACRLHNNKVLTQQWQKQGKP